MYEKGEITKEEIKNHPKKNYITKAVGVADTVAPDYFEVDIDENAVVVLCSDGLSNYCDEDVLLGIVQSSEREEIAEKLINTALNGGGGDNVTVAVIA